MLTAEIVAIGSELLTPDRTDTNSLWLTEKLNSIGIEVKLKTIVGDDDARLEGVIKDAVRRSQVVLTTGGLGPTEDDITRKVVSRALARRLSFNTKVLESIRERFRQMERPMPEINSRQAMIIEGAEVLENPHGTAPGMLIEHNGSTLGLMPGPLRELRPMFETYILARLRELSTGVHVVRRIMRVAGMGESAVDELIAPAYVKYKNPQTTILTNKSDIEIRLTAQAVSEAEGNKLLDDLAEQIEERLGVYVFSFRGESMEEVVGLRLALGGYTLAVAESCTGGLICQRLTNIPGSSKYFIEGVIAYSNEAKVEMLGVPRELIEKHGAVSPEVAKAMADGIRLRSGTDFGLSVTGIAGPDGGSESKPIGTVYIALADDTHREQRNIIFPGDRELIRWHASQAALDLLRLRIM